MVTQNYKRSFEHNLLSYTKRPSRIEITYREHRLADQLVDHLVRDLVRDVISNPLEELRVKAAKKLGQWGNNHLELRVLTRVAEVDPNLELREAAVTAIVQIRARMYE